MSRKKIVVWIGVVLVSLNMLTACGQEEVSQMIDEPPKYYNISIDGDYLPRGEEDIDVKTVSEVSKGFLEAYINVDYKNIDTVTEYSYYKKEVYDNYMQINLPESEKASMIKNQLVIKLYENDIKKMEFYKLRGQEASTVVIEYICAYTEARPEYLNQIKVNKGSKYKRTITINYINEENEWRVQSTSLTAREEV